MKVEILDSKSFGYCCLLCGKTEMTIMRIDFDRDETGKTKQISHFMNLYICNTCVKDLKRQIAKEEIDYCNRKGLHNEADVDVEKT